MNIKKLIIVILFPLISHSQKCPEKTKILEGIIIFTSGTNLKHSANSFFLNKKRFNLSSVSRKNEKYVYLFSGSPIKSGTHYLEWIISDSTSCKYKIIKNLNQ